MKSFVFACKSMILIVVAHSLSAAQKILPRKYAHIGARVDNCTLLTTEDLPVDNHEEDELYAQAFKNPLVKAQF